MQIVTIANQKGGTAKSTTTAALAQAAASKGLRVLAIDLDPQGNLSFFLSADTSGPGSYGLLEGDPLGELVQRPTESGPWVIPASRDLAAVKSGTGSARRLQKALEPIKGSYDLVIIDTPPTAGELQYNALQAADQLVIPLQADIVGLQGLYQIVETAQQIQNTNPALEISGFILTRHNNRSTLAKQMQETIIEKAQELEIPFLQAIREAVAIREAQTMQESLYDYAPKSKPAADYMELLQKIMND